MLVNQKKNKGKETQTYLKSKKGIPMLMRILELRTLESTQEIGNEVKLKPTNAKIEQVAIEEKSLKSMTKRNKKEEKRHNTSC
jgi:hypothetical protein